MSSELLQLLLVGLLCGLAGWAIGRRTQDRWRARAQDAEAGKRAAEDKMSFLKENDKSQMERYQQLSAKVLEQSQNSFFKLANEKLGQQQQLSEKDLKHRQKAIENLVAPLAQNLEKVQARIQDIEKSREGAYSALKQQITDLKDGNHGLKHETSKLVAALKQPTGRGQWGEMQLKRVVELAGMIEHCDFETQVSEVGESGRILRPDLIVRLPAGRSIVVDSKAPLDAYLAALEAETEGQRVSELKRHAEQVSTHIKQLSSKAYQRGFGETPEFVVLFLPSEALFAAALEQNPGLIEYALGFDVIPATPTTLIALLRTVSQGWREESLTEDAREIARLGAELYQRCGKLAEHFNKLGNSLEQSLGHYNSAVGSLESRVMVTGRQLEEWNGKLHGKSIPDLEARDVKARQMETDQGSDQPSDSYTNSQK